MAMTTPVVTQRVQSEGVKMEMTTPVIQQVRTESKHLQTDLCIFEDFLIQDHMTRNMCKLKATAYMVMLLAHTIVLRIARLIASLE